MTYNAGSHSATNEVIDADGHSSGRVDARQHMDESVIGIRLGAILFIALFAGCASTGAISEPAVDAVSRPGFLTQLQNVDSIQIEHLTLSERKDISRFVQICRNARWAPFIATMPAKVKTIRFLSDGVETHRLLYAGGWLLNTSEDGIVTFGTIHADDSEWMDENIDTQLMLMRNTL